MPNLALDPTTLVRLIESTVILVIAFLVSSGCTGASGGLPAAPSRQRG